MLYPSISRARIRGEDDRSSAEESRRHFDRRRGAQTGSHAVRYGSGHKCTWSQSAFAVVLFPIT
eukprot:7394555-Pyramimonas_sp.AAC.1